MPLPVVNFAIYELTRTVELRWKSPELYESDAEAEQIRLVSMRVKAAEFST